MKSQATATRSGGLLSIEFSGVRCVCDSLGRGLQGGAVSEKLDASCSDSLQSQSAGNFRGCPTYQEQEQAALQACYRG